MYKIVGFFVLLILPFNSISQLQFVSYDNITDSRYRQNILLKKIDIAIAEKSWEKAKVLLSFAYTYGNSKYRVQDIESRLKIAMTNQIKSSPDTVKFKKIKKFNIAKLDKSKNQKTIYLTFDDGPMKGTTNVIDVINKEQVPATMFVVGRHIVSSLTNRSRYNKIRDNRYMLIANHTYSHAHDRYNAFYTSSQREILKDISKNHKLLRDDMLSNSPPYTRLAGRNVFRLPTYVSDDPYITRRQLRREKPSYDMLWHEGYYMYGWDIEWGISKKTKTYRETPHRLAQKIERLYKEDKLVTKGKVIVLMHDKIFQDKYNGKKNLTRLIQILKANNWKFETLEDYLSIDDIKNGKYAQQKKLFDIDKFAANRSQQKRNKDKQADSSTSLKADTTKL